MLRKPLLSALLIVLASIGFAVVVVSVNDYLRAPRQSMVQGYTTVRASFHGEELNLAHANTPALRVRGLSGRSSLAPFHGMLFTFDEPGRHGIWMKDMRFSIDILWLDEEKKIIEITSQVAPDTYPVTFSPAKAARYVIELPSGKASRLNLKIGDVVEFSAE